MFHRNRLIMCVYAAIALAIGCLPLPAFAQNSIPVIPFSKISGPPKVIERKLPAGFYIRRGVEKPDDEIVLVTHGMNGDKTRGIVFTGTVTVHGGPILIPRPLYLEKDHKDAYLLRGSVLEFRFFTLGEVDALGFHVPKGLRATFALFADGRPVQAVAFGGKPDWVNGNVFTLDTAQ